MSHLLSDCSSGGCGAKIGPGELAGILAGLPAFQDERMLVGFDSSDDAAVFQVTAELAIVSTVDFFTPMVDDPCIFGQIAAANALSDIYAMGGTPIFALNLVTYPEKQPIGDLGLILSGGAEKVKEAGAVLSGGHSIYDKEIKYGLAVTGQVDPARVWKNNTARPGDRLILSKPLGVGIVMAALRGEQADQKAVTAAVASMMRLNKYAAEAMHRYPVHACTDITGFGLLAHLKEMTRDETAIVLETACVPYIPEARFYAEEFLTTAAGQRNRNFIEGQVNLNAVPLAMQEMLLDPQTSGGLVFAIPAEWADEALAAVRSIEPEANMIGEVIARTAEQPLILI